MLPSITWVSDFVVYTTLGGILDPIRLACWLDEDGVVTMVTAHSDARGFGAAKVNFG